MEKSNVLMRLQEERELYCMYSNRSNTTTYDVGISGLGLRQAQKCGGVKSVNEIPTLPSLDFYIKLTCN
jgi:hypothetical protein